MLASSRTRVWVGWSGQWRFAWVNLVPQSDKTKQKSKLNENCNISHQMLSIWIGGCWIRIPYSYSSRCCWAMPQASSFQIWHDCASDFWYNAYSELFEICHWSVSVKRLPDPDLPVTTSWSIGTFIQTFFLLPPITCIRDNLHQLKDWNVTWCKPIWCKHLWTTASPPHNNVADCVLTRSWADKRFLSRVKT